MTSTELRAWQETMGYSYAQACAELGVGSSTYADMLSGAAKINRRTALACSALSAGLGEWAPMAAEVDTPSEHG
ncbi:helix-turn-helix transcriptional regulator [Acidovorax sp. GBBC 3332]|nr:MULTISPECIES: helix-turn-helix transcriptional regulator [unclassified Acidovorax]MDA8448507.1 helix-turn-helix transcriptional regulator [Acidovorax sp. GBBC 3297]MDA8457526.1 helix-turn-helix transcriptional regulator [Acidovorax sp. GBBC 3333]MDA8462950.1 helix-turn-helix transcriptional regulator [Acidovorax sp. GBBC 3332]MDA8467596.1 helix-turn-helix transcriptional regulator [Acidovorax sp. GBBC 3299]